MDRLNVNILAVCKTRWVNNGDFINDKQRAKVKRKRVILIQDIEMCSAILSTM